MFVDEFRELYVVTTILRDLEQPAFLEPMDRLHAFGRLLDAERGRGDGIERKPMLQRAGLSPSCPASEADADRTSIAANFVVEPRTLKPTTRSALQVREQVADVSFAINAVLARAVLRDRPHAHAADASQRDFIGGLLRLEVEINDVLRHVSGLF